MELDEFLKEWHSPAPYVVAHTSGSTGEPKEVRLLKSDMETSARNTCGFFGIDSKSTLYLPLAIDYIAGKMQVVRSLVAGGKIEVVKPSNALFPHHDLEYDLVPIVPSQIAGVLASGLRARNVIVGGAAMSPTQEKMIMEGGFKNVYQSYGMTETCSHVALRRAGEEEYAALDGFRFSQDERGCLVVESDKMSFSRLVTNDVVELIDSQRFRYVGRADFAINSGGIKIHPQRIEQQLFTLLPGRKFYVSSRPSDRWGREAVLVILDNEPLDQAKLLEKARQLLGNQAPKAVIRDSCPEYTPSGKLKRRQF